MLNDFEKILISEEEIYSICDELAAKITADYKDSGKRLVLICILKGSVIFCSELMKRIKMPVEVEFMKASSYGSSTTSTGVIKVHLDINRDDLSDADFILIEDIIDSGRTLSHLITYLAERGANSVKTCTLLDKPSRRVIDLVPDYYGFKVPDEFLVGFGLDYDEKYRNLPFVAILKREVYGG